MGLQQCLRARSRRAGGPALSQSRRPGRGTGQERPLHRRAGSDGLRLRRGGHGHAQAAAGQPAAAHVPAAAGACADQPPRLQQRRAGRLRAQRAGRALSPAGPAARAEHRQERRDADRGGHGRLSRMPGRRVPACRLRDGQHLQPQHREPARAAGRRGTRRPALGDRRTARAALCLARPPRAAVREDRARPRGSAGGGDRSHAAPPRHGRRDRDQYDDRARAGQGPRARRGSRRPERQPGAGAEQPRHRATARGARHRLSHHRRGWGAERARRLVQAARRGGRGADLHGPDLSRAGAGGRGRARISSDWPAAAERPTPVDASRLGA